MNKDLSQLYEQFINECRFSACLRPETIRGYSAVFILFLKVMPEVTTTNFLTHSILNEFFKRIQTRQRIVGKNIIKTGVKKSTIKTQWSKLNVFFDWLYNKGLLKENPLKNIKPPQPIYDDFRKLENDQIHKIYSAITRCSCNTLLLRRDTMMVSLLLFCGVRRGEFISLQMHEIDISKREITIKGETSKSKRTRILKIHPTLLLHLREYLRERNSRGIKTEYLIVSNNSDAGLTRDGLKHWVHNLIKKSGVKFHLHQFRHTFACKLAEENVNIFKIQKMMGHSNISMTMKYARSMKTENMEDDIGKISI